jgi:hypothetical protein
MLLFQAAAAHENTRQFQLDTFSKTVKEMMKFTSQNGIVFYFDKKEEYAITKSGVEHRNKNSGATTIINEENYEDLMGEIGSKITPALFKITENWSTLDALFKAARDHGIDLKDIRRPS